jgi:hypothetical protein
MTTTGTTTVPIVLRPQNQQAETPPLLRGLFRREGPRDALLSGIRVQLALGVAGPIQSGCRAYLKVECIVLNQVNANVVPLRNISSY